MDSRNLGTTDEAETSRSTAQSGCDARSDRNGGAKQKIHVVCPMWSITATHVEGRSQAPSDHHASSSLKIKDEEPPAEALRQQDDQHPATIDPGE
ncbi:hypothetical protein, partial [Rhizocola hellebori]|uniref:hypothetical protein n=1 Tax=Rhizocola hellebori TaxID=1392758 RepID=UPI0019410533